MKVQEYLKEHGLQKLQDEFSIVVTDYPDRVVLNYNQIDSPRFHPICEECRALILRKDTWEVMARSFDRFYNVGEGEEWKKFPINDARIEEKLDGSILSAYHDRDKWCVSTRKMAFAEGTLPIGITFRQLFDKAIEGTRVMEILNRHMLPPEDTGLLIGSPKDFTWVFELTSPENRVVTPYADRKVTLIGARYNPNQYELTGYCLDHMAKFMMVKRPKIFECNSIEDLQRKAEELNIMDEGFVLVVEKAQRMGSHWRLKCKNPKYVAIAHMRENGNISPKRIMSLILTNEHPEYLSYFPEDKEYFDFCKRIFAQSAIRMKAIAVENMPIKDQKKFALSIMSKTEYPYENGVIFQTRKKIQALGGELDYNKIVEVMGDIVRNMEGKKVSESLGLRDKFAKKFGLKDEDEG